VNDSTTIPATPWFYAVVLPDANRVLYKGQSLASAARCLKPGAWHGRGLTMAEACLNAWRAAAQTTLEAGDAV
jgi:hypothetical protein